MLDIERFNRYDVVIIMGRSCSGKDTLIENLLKLDEDNSKQYSCNRLFTKVLTYTDREKRNSDDDKTHKFVSTKEILEMTKNNNACFSTVINDINYLTTYDLFDSTKYNLITLNPAAVKTLVESKPSFPRCKIFYVNTRFEDLIERAIIRAYAITKEALINGNKDLCPNFFKTEIFFRIPKYISEDTEDIGAFSRFFRKNHIDINDVYMGVKHFINRKVTSEIDAFIDRHEEVVRYSFIYVLNTLINRLIAEDKEFSEFENNFTTKFGNGIYFTDGLNIDSDLTNLILFNAVQGADKNKYWIKRSYSTYTINKGLPTEDVIVNDIKDEVIAILTKDEFDMFITYRNVVTSVKDFLIF